MDTVLVRNGQPATLVLAALVVALIVLALALAIAVEIGPASVASADTSPFRWT